MKRTGILLLLVTISLLACADNRQEERQAAKPTEESGEAADVANDSLSRETGEARNALQKGIQDLDREIGRLQEKARTATQDAKPEINRQIDRLKATRVDAAKELDKMRQVTKENWQNMKKDAASIRERITKTIEESRKR